MKKKKDRGELPEGLTEQFAKLSAFCFVSSNLTPVSYTHLDVYKRQE